MRQQRGRRRRGALAALLALVCATSAAQAFEPKPQPKHLIDWNVTGPKIFDAVVLRPLGAGASLAGIGFFVIAAPLSWYAEGGYGAAWDTFVKEPVDFTFRRPLGDF